MIATLMPVTAFASGETPITEVSLTNNSIPETITSDMNLTNAMLNATCESDGFTILSQKWYNNTGGGDLNVGSAFAEGDVVCVTFTLKANEGYVFDDSLEGNKTDVTLNGKSVTHSTLWNMDGDSTDKELVASVEHTVQAAQSAQSNCFEIALDNVAPDGTLPESLGYVQYAVIDPSDSTQSPVDLAEDYDGSENGVVLTTGTTGGEHPSVKYTYTVNDTTKHFLLYVTPADGKTATIYTDNQGTLTQIGSVNSSDSTNYLVRNVTPDVRYRVEFTDAGGPAPGGQQGTDPAPSADAAKVQFYDQQGNCISYEQFKNRVLGALVQYGRAGSTAEFGATAVNDDPALYWYTDQSDPEPANWTETYYFNASDASGVDIWGSSNLEYEVGDTKGSFSGGPLFESGLVQSGQTLKIFPKDDGVRNITWSDDAQEASQKVEHGKVIIEKAVIGEENALITDGQYSQQGNKGYVGVKGGATVTVKLIPDYGYQVGTLELNGQRLTPQDEEATYTFTMPDTNLHLRAIFEESSDEIKADAAGVTGGSIAGGENVIDSGNLRLSVIDSNMTDEQKAQMQNSAAGSNTDILNYLEVDLEKFVNKGNSGEEWTEDLEELSEKIEITLNVGTDLDANKTYVVVREHNGVYEQIPATYDKAAGTLTFESDKFSDYALAAVSDDNSDQTSAAGTDRPQTGDNSNMALWFALLLASGAGVLGITVYSRKKKSTR